MLIQLMKFNIATTYRWITKTYLATFVVLILFLTTMFFDQSVLYDVLMILFFGCMILIFIVLIIITYKLFINRLVLNGGYLTLSLPVSGIQIFFAQLLVGAFWILTTIYFINAIMAITTTFIFVFLSGSWSAFPMDGSVAQQLSLLFKDSGLLIKVVIWVLADIPNLYLNSCYLLASILFSAIFVNSNIINRFRVIFGILTFFTINLLFYPIAEILLVDPVETSGIDLKEVFTIEISTEVEMPFLEDLKNFEVEINWLKYGGVLLFYIPVIGGLGYLSGRLLERRFELK